MAGNVDSKLLLMFKEVCGHLIIRSLQLSSSCSIDASLFWLALKKMPSQNQKNWNIWDLSLHKFRVKRTVANIFQERKCRCTDMMSCKAERSTRAEYFMDSVNLFPWSYDDIKVCRQFSLLYAVKKSSPFMLWSRHCSMDDLMWRLSLTHASSSCDL